METRTEVDTKVSKDAPESVKTNLTINWDGLTDDEVRAMAQQALIVKLQNSWRKNGIPNGDFTVMAAEHKVGSRAARKPFDLMASVATLTAEQKAELLARLTA